MPYTKRIVHHYRADDLLDYIMDEEKTDGGLLISGVNCNPDLAKQEFKNNIDKWENKGTRVAYHLIQSFAPYDNISAEQAHEIGVRMTKELYPNFQCVVTTHINAGHIHNHIAISAVNLLGKKLEDKLSNEKEGLYAYKNKSDEIAKEYGCYVMPKFQFNRKEKGNSSLYYSYKHQTWKTTILDTLNKIKVKSNSIDEFVLELFNNGYDVKYGKYISVKPQGKEKFVRLKTLSEEFSEDNLRLYFSGKNIEYNIKYKSYNQNDFNEKYVDYHNELKTALQLTSSIAIKGGNYPTFQRTRKRASIRIEQLEQMLNMLEKNNINNYDELETKIKLCRSEIKKLNIDIKKYENQNKELLEKADKAQMFISLNKTYEYAIFYKSVDKNYKMPKECDVYEEIKKELGINTVDEAREIIKNSRQVRINVNKKKSSVYDMQQELYQYELFKEKQLLKSDAFLHNIKVGNNRIDYTNSTDEQWCINLPYSNYYIFVDKSLSTYNHKYGYNTLFLIDDKKYQIYSKTSNNGLQKEIMLSGEQIERFIDDLKKQNIEMHK